jgi:acyl-coenzyme A synthetase/AMP-(fatty) acid ligase
MPGAEWFPGATLNYAERALSPGPGRGDEDAAVVFAREDGLERQVTRAELRDLVGRCRAGLARLGVGRGDRVVALAPNCVETLVAFLATASLGAVWSSCSPDFGARAVRDRFAQIEPAVLIAVVRVTPRGSYVIYGRSDSTLNRGGIRMGTADFYAVVEGSDQVADSLVIDTTELGAGQGQLLCFLVLAPGATLTDLEPQLRQGLRSELSPRHVPDRFIVIDAVTRTLSGKKLEVPVKKILAGIPVGQAVSKNALQDPEALTPFLQMATELRIHPPPFCLSDNVGDDAVAAAGAAAGATPTHGASWVCVGFVNVEDVTQLCVVICGPCAQWRILYRSSSGLQG